MCGSTEGATLAELATGRLATMRRGDLQVAFFVKSLMKYGDSAKKRAIRLVKYGGKYGEV